MALFQRFQKRDQLVQIAHEQPAVVNEDDGFIKLIVGLGNVGQAYRGTRHNLGFAVVDSFRQQHGFPAWQTKPKFKAFISEDFLNGQKVILAKPTTLMNLSGQAVQALKQFYKLANKDIVVVHDELDLPFGVVKEKLGGAGGTGNNGLKNIGDCIGTDFKRLRLGIKNDQLGTLGAPDFVLAKFSASEKKQLAAIIQTACEKLI